MLLSTPIVSIAHENHQAHHLPDAFGNSIDFGLDFHGRVAAPVARVLIKELEPYRPLFIEEPVLAEQAEYYPRLAACTPIPLAAGERMFSRFEFKRVLEEGGISILQPDLSHVVNKYAFALEDGYAKPFDKPGLGVEVDEALVIERSRDAAEWRNPLWRHRDGSVAEW